MLIYREASIHDAEAIARTEVASKEASLVGAIEFHGAGVRIKLRSPTGTVEGLHRKDSESEKI